MPKPNQSRDIDRLLETSIYLGIDPGIKGGIVALIPDWLLSHGGVYNEFGEKFNNPVVYTPMPITELDLWNSLIGFKPHSLQCSIIACIEQVHSMPKQGVKSMFTFGQNYGSLRMALTILTQETGGAWHTVRSQEWMKALKIPSKAGEEYNERKERLRGIAQRMYPTLPIWSEPKSLGRQRAICDALLIARYCKLAYKD